MAYTSVVVREGQRKGRERFEWREVLAQLRSSRKTMKWREQSRQRCKSTLIVDRNKIGKCKVKNDCLRDVSERQSAYPLQVRDVEMNSACTVCVSRSLTTSWSNCKSGQQIVSLRMKNSTTRYRGYDGLVISSAWAGAVSTEHIEEHEEHARRQAEFCEAQAGSDSESSGKRSASESARQ